MRHNLFAALLILAASFLFALHDSISKSLMVFFAVPLIVWMRYLVSLLAVVAYARAGHSKFGELVTTQRPVLMGIRAIALVSVSLLYQSGLKTMPMAEATALIFTTPLLVAIFSGPVLGEKVQLRTWLATLAGFGGILLIARPGGTLPGIGLAYILASALCYATYQILTRKLSDSDPPLRQLFFTSAAGTILMGFSVPTCWPGGMPTPTQGGLILSLGLLAAGGHFLVIHAFRKTQASTLSPLLYVQLVWAMILGWMVFGQFPDMLTTAGMVTIGLASLSLALHKPSPNP